MNKGRGGGGKERGGEGGEERKGMMDDMID